MKKIILILILTIFTASLAVAGGSGEGKNIVTRDENGRLNVTTTIFPPYDFVRQIAGDRVNLTMLLVPGAESHSFEPSPRNIITIQNSGLFIHIGGEEWVERILRSMNTNNMIVASLTSMVELLEEELIEGMENTQFCDTAPQQRGIFARIFPFLAGSNDSDICEIFYDEHVWTSPRNAIIIVREITDLLCTADAANAVFYRQNAASYIAELERLDASLRAVVAGGRRKIIVFSDRFPFRYLAHHYGLEYYAAFPGCYSQSDPGAATIAFLINKIRSERIPVVFHIEFSNERIADTISGETGARKLLLHAAHNVSRNEFNAGLTYLEIMRRNIANLRTALN